MVLVDYILLVLAAAAGLAAAIGGIMLSLPTYSTRAIEAVFYVAAISFGSLGIVWGSLSNYSLGTRMVVAGVTAAVAAMGLIYVLSLIGRSEETSQAQEASNMASPNSPPVNVIINNNIAIPRPEPPTGPPKSQNKYVCAATVSPRTPGRYAMLFEFGVKEKSTSGLGASIVLSRSYIDTVYWQGGPLRTDMPPDTASVYFMISENRDKQNGVFALKYQSPDVTPERSAYVYIDSDQPFEIRKIFFLEDFQAFNEPLKADSMANEFGPCPR